MKLEDIAGSLIRGDADAVARLTREALDGGVDPKSLLRDALIAGMDTVGGRFRSNEIFIPEVLIAARAMKAGMQHLEPVLAACGVRPVGRCLIGTVSGDIHDIGKNLVTMMLRGGGFEVIDLGVNVPLEGFLDGIERHRPHIVGMSALLTTTMVQMQVNIEEFRRAGLTDRLKVMVGGAPVSESFARQIGADGFAADAAGAKDEARALLRTVGGE
ncbi:MAG: cobalamin-binding protein [Acidobacteria bacterium]|nr:cobalamin-binding protein [Acidobacteriota bacterium]